MKKQEKFRGKYRIESSRAQWHSYDDGIFFVTFCTKNRRHSLGEIVGGEMMLSKIGEYMDQEIRDVSVRHPYAQIPFWAVMPDHVHLLIKIDPEMIPYPHTPAQSIETAPQARLCRDNAASVSRSSQSTQEYILNRMHSWLSVVVGGIKSRVTKYAMQSHIPFAWQARFYDRIVRDEPEMNRIAKYIQENVSKWGNY